MKDTSCCFSGHRPDKLPYGYEEKHADCMALKRMLAQEIREMRGRGVDTFLSGMAQGPDIWCAEIVQGMQRADPDARIRLIAVLPFEGQADRWPEEYRERYFNILAGTDEVITLQAHYSADCMHRRNRYLVDASAHLLAVYAGQAGGTQQTVAYAARKGLDIVILHPGSLQRLRPEECTRSNIIRFER